MAAAAEAASIVSTTPCASSVRVATIRASRVRPFWFTRPIDSYATVTPIMVQYVPSKERAATRLAGRSGSDERCSADHSQRRRGGAPLVLRRWSAYVEGELGGDRRHADALRGPHDAGQGNAAAHPR